MSQDGKLARAMAKAGGADKLTSAPADTSSAPASAPSRIEKPSSEAEPPHAPAIRRVPFAGVPPEYDAVMMADRTCEAASQIRALRAKVVSINNGDPPRTITVTSGGRLEGKTTIALNLAAALSEVETGRVLLVDGDVLQPSMESILHLNVQGGLAAVLADPGLSLDLRIHETALPNLDVLPTRAIAPADIPEAAFHQNIARLFRNLRRLYSFIVVDTPPVMTGSQAVAFGRCSDGVIVVVRLEKTPRHVVKRTIEDLTSVGARVIGCVLTHHRHHVPNFIYRFFGTPPSHYYRYYGSRAKGVGKQAKVPEPEDSEG